jgi:hypothetical protein
VSRTTCVGIGTKASKPHSPNEDLAPTRDRQHDGFRGAEAEETCRALVVSGQGGCWPSVQEVEAVRAVPVPPNCRKMAMRWRAASGSPDVREIL